LKESSDELLQKWLRFSDRSTEIQVENMAEIVLAN
jgi:hypothetical protein